MASIQTLANLRTQVLSWLDEASASSTSSTYTNATNALNQAHQLRLTQQPWPFMLWDTAETFALVSGTADYTLHSEFLRPLYFYNRTTSQFLAEVPFRGVEQFGIPQSTETGSSNEFVLASRDCVVAQPASASTLAIVSSSTADDGAAWTVIVRGVTTNGVISETLTADGTATVTSTNTFSKILNVTKTGTWAGTLTLTAGITTCLILTANEYGRSYPKLTLLRTPGASDTIEYKFYRQPSPLSNDNDIPDIPPPFAQILVWDTLLLFAAYNSDISGQAVAMWRDNQQKLENQMRQAFEDAQSLGAQGRYIRYLGDDQPRVRFIR